MAALDEVSAQRRQRYEEALAGVHRPSDLVELAARVFSEDLDTGDAALLVEMIAGATSTPGLGAEVKARMEPWTEFAVAALDQTLRRLPPGRRWWRRPRSPTPWWRSIWVSSSSPTSTVTVRRRWPCSTGPASWPPWPTCSPVADRAAPSVEGRRVSSHTQEEKP